MRILDRVLVVLLIVVHLTLHVGFGIAGAAPDLFTLALLIVARESHMAVAALWGLALGLLEDAQGLLAFGANAVALALVGAAGARTREFFVGDSYLFVGLYLFLGKFARDVVYWVAMGSDDRADGLGSLVLDAGAGALYMTLVGLVLVVTTGVLQRSARVR